MNNTIKLLMISDIFIITGFGLIDPILAIFIKDNLIDGTIFTAGLSTTLFLVTKSIIQLPFSRYVDSHDDKVRFLIIGTLLISFVPFIYIFATSMKYIYIAQFIHGIGSGLAFPTWLGLWSSHLDRKHESFEWSLYSAIVSIGTAIAGALGAAIAQFLSFRVSFFIVFIASLIGSSILFGLERKEGKKTKEIKIMHYHQKRKSHHLHKYS